MRDVVVEAVGVRALPPLFFESGASGVSVSEPAGKETSRATDLFELAGEGFLPQLRPGLAAGRIARLCLMLYPRAGAAGDLAGGRGTRSGGVLTSSVAKSIDCIGRSGASDLMN